MAIKLTRIRKSMDPNVKWFTPPLLPKYYLLNSLLLKTIEELLISEDIIYKLDSNFDDNLTKVKVNQIVFSSNDSFEKYKNKITKVQELFDCEKEYYNTNNIEETIEIDYNFVI